MANKVLLVAQREYLDNVRTKTFWLGILALPVLLAISIGAGVLLNKLKETRSYAVVDHSAAGIAARIEREARSRDVVALARLLARGLQGNEQMHEQLIALQRELGDSLAGIAKGGAEGDAAADVPADVQGRIFAWLQGLPAADAEALGRQQSAMRSAAKYGHRSLASLGLDRLPPAEQEKRLNQLVNDKQLFAYFVVGEHPERSIEDFRYVSNNRTDDDLRDWYSDAATKVVQDLRIADAGIPRDVAQRLQERVSFREEKVTASGEREDVKAADKATQFAPVAFVYLLWIAIFTAAQMLLTNTVEEKSNRIIEVLLSSVSPLQLMAGKIWGIAATGLTIVGSWVVCALVAASVAPKLIAGVDMPWMQIVGDPLYLGSFVAYFFFGYLLYAAILVGIGSVCNSLKEAQNLLQPVFILLIVPLVSMMFIVQEPNGMVARVLSYVPLFTPFTMMNRAGGPPELYEYVITSVLLLASVWFAFKAAGKIFRVGVLMTGNPPKLREILSWLRE